jgi:hypothetical protein
MPSARKAGVPPEVLQEWEADFRKKKAEQAESGGKKLPSGSVQYTYNDVTYTAKFSGPNRNVSFPEAAYEARVEGSRSRKGEQQKIKLSEAEQLLQQYRYEDAKMLSEYLGQPIEVEHGIPISKGGFSNDPNNLGLATRETNLTKRDKLGGSEYNRALEENKYLSNLANELRSERGAIKFRRSAVTGMAAAGIAALGPLGTAVSAAETAGRKEIADETGNPIDRAQQYISGASLAADAASYAPPLTVPATIVSTGLDAINVGIDTTRGFINLFTRR